jgi:hypothetical protein
MAGAIDDNNKETCFKFRINLEKGHRELFIIVFQNAEIRSES